MKDKMIDAQMTRLAQYKSRNSIALSHARLRTNRVHMYGQMLRLGMLLHEAGYTNTHVEAAHATITGEPLQPYCSSSDRAVSEGTSGALADIRKSIANLATMQHADFVASGDGHRSRGNGGNGGNIGIGGIGDSIDVGDSDIDSIGIGGGISNISDSIGGVGGIMMSCDIRSSDSSDELCDSVSLPSVKLVSSVKLPSSLGVSDVSCYVSLYLAHLDLAALSVLSEQQVDMIEATHRSLL